METWCNSIQILSALLTPAIAVVVVVIAWLQYRTARHRTMIDLFDRRYAAYISVNQVIGPILSSGNVLDTNASLGLATAMQNIQFLFGKDVTEHLNDIFDTIISMEEAEKMLRQENRSDYNRWVKSKGEHFIILRNLYDKFPSICEPYIKLDKK